MTRPNWAKVARECATAWMKFGPAEHFLAMKLVAQLECHDAPKPGKLADEVDRAMRGTLSGGSNHRRATLKAAERLKEAGLLFEHEGLVYVLYDEASVRKYGHLAPAYEAAKTVPNKVRRAANDNAIARTQDVTGAYSARTRNESTPRNHSEHVLEREREINQKTSSSGGAPQAAPTQAVINFEQERAKREPPPKPPKDPGAKRKRAPRKLSPLDFAKAEARAIFNRHYAPRHNGVQSWAGHNLLTPLVGCYMRQDGTFQRELFERAAVAFLDDPRWAQPGERGHGLEVFAWKHDRYDAPTPQQPPPPRGRPRNYA